jgi:hypothetical protein
MTGGACLVPFPFAELFFAADFLGVFLLIVAPGSGIGFVMQTVSLRDR